MSESAATLHVKKPFKVKKTFEVILKYIIPKIITKDNTLLFREIGTKLGVKHVELILTLNIRCEIFVTTLSLT